MAEQTLELEKELTYELLLTLLEHQFCSPVQWITTQDALLDPQTIQKCVEIGPSDTLRAMMKKTLDQKRRSHTFKNAPECLTFSDELEWLNKASEPEVVDEEPEIETANEPIMSQPAPVAPTPAISSPPVATPQAAAVEIEDLPVTALEAVLAIVASGLKTGQANVDTSQSVKFLAKGRSALQNEIIGNLVNEFGTLPDAVEDLALVELGKELQKSFSGKLGGFLNELLGKKLAAKLSPAFTVSKLRSKLKESFGLSHGRQDSWFLTVNFEEIPSRLDDTQSWETVSRWTQSYMKDRGLEFQRQEASSSGANPATAPIQTANDPRMAKFGKDLADLMSKHFKPEEKPGESGIGGKEDQKSTGNISVDELSKELGDEFMSGIQPYFRPELVYKYRSGWAWAIQDLYVTLSQLIAESANQDETQLLQWIDVQCERLRSRATDRVTKCSEYLLNRWEASSEKADRKYCMLLLRKLLEPAASKSRSLPKGRLLPRTLVTDDGEIVCREIPESGDEISGGDVNNAADAYRGSSSSSAPGDASRTPSSSWSLVQDQVRICSQNSLGGWETDTDLTSQFHAIQKRSETAEDGPMAGSVLIVGAGRQSIGFVLVRRLLSKGCRVALCTSRLTLANRKLYSQMFAQVAKPGAELVLLPFNQGSIQDITNLINYIHGDLGWQIDHLVPFAAISEVGRTVEDIDSTSELAHRIMLTNTLRLIGAIAASKRQRHILYHCTQVLLPLSPNHGTFGGDGLYAESKLALEAMMNKWHSEAWSDAISLCAVRIGWTRGTGLMSGNDALAEDVEKLGVRTFAAEEMAELLSLVMLPEMYEACTLQPLLCDFTGGLGSVPDLKERIDGIRAALEASVSVRRRLKQESERDNAILKSSAPGDTPSVPKERRAKIRQEIPVLPERYEDAIPENAANLTDLIDLDSTVVITGFAELGSIGGSRTRWELESQGEFSLEGCIELAWMMGMTRYERKRMHNGEDFGAGWVEIDTGKPIKDFEVKEKYERRILEHTGMRLLHPDPWQSSPDPRLRDMLQEIGMQEDMPPFECTSQAAGEMKSRHGDALEIVSDDGTNATVRIRQGASIFVPKSLNSEYFVAAQIPDGWDPKRYGVPEDVATSVTRPGLYALCCVAEAFLCASITDVYELYRYIHPTEVGNCIGSGAGGSTALQAFHERRLLGKEVPNDILSDAFVGSVAAWINLLLLSASGPIKTAAGTCATSLESLDTAYDLVSNGRVKMCLAGGYDTYTRPIYYEFGTMQALNNASQDERCGRDPKEMSRPFTTTRGGFVLGDGIGMQVVTSASLALQMGLPIYGIVAMTHMASDKLGRSMPAPGRGLLSSAKQTKAAAPCLLMDPALRSKRIKTSLGHISNQEEADIEAVKMEADFMLARGEDVSPEDTEAHIQGIREAARRERKAVLRELGNNYWKNNPSISPITGALSVWGLTIDDITFASLHGTATKLNDLNESKTVDEQMQHLGRHPNNPLYTIAQKSVCGHGLGASGAWALNGGLQAMHAGIIPGNRNADDIDEKLEAYENLLLLNTNIELPKQEMKAFSVTSFGFGQKGAQVIVVHPRYLYSAITKEEYETYRAKQVRRSRLAARELDRGLHGEGLFKAKEKPPYDGDEKPVMLDPHWRLS